MTPSQSLLYTSDPNQYILKMSKIKHSIQNSLPIQLKSKNPIIKEQIQKQFLLNFNKYKKQTLIRQRIQLAKNHQKNIENKRKASLQYYIQEKIKQSQKYRINYQKQLIEKIKMERLTRQAIVSSKKKKLRNQNVRKSLEIIQKLQKKYNKDINDLQIKQSRYTGISKIFNNPEYSRVVSSKRASSLSMLPRINRNKPFHNEKKQSANKFFISQIQQKQQPQQTGEQLIQKMMKQYSTKGSRSKSFSTLSQIHHENKKKSNQSNQQQQFLSKIIEQRQVQGYNKFVEKKSIGYQANKFSRHKQIKQAFESYLKKHIKKIDIDQSQNI